MSTHRYAPRALNADLLRAAVGTGFCLVPLVFVDLGAWGILVFAIPAAMFTIFGLRTWANRQTVVEIDAVGISLTGWSPRHIAWRDMSALKLSYFSTRRDREAGWMQLSLKDRTTKIALNPSLDGFEDVCRAAFNAARNEDIELTDASARNFAALGIGAAIPERNPTPASMTGWGNPADWRR
ncbi:MAG: hypothetical protein CL566_04470 [Alphaproteobacteria bacterium]|jgi:hypothetical protein|nr:hypothetical protein [Alphaproteobacteria bacterium]|tara:strand:+ start:209 stop:754 length:546 start_codon:yes stop_codon:yes gene_type:complete